MKIYILKSASISGIKCSFSLTSSLGRVCSISFFSYHLCCFVPIGPRLFLSCPMDVEGSRVWFTDLWNYSLVPYLLEAVREGLQVHPSDACFQFSGWQTKVTPGFQKYPPVRIYTRSSSSLERSEQLLLLCHIAWVISLKAREFSVTCNTTQIWKCLFANVCFDYYFFRLWTYWHCCPWSWKKKSIPYFSVWS